jgi:hypothetical protein
VVVNTEGSEGACENFEEMNQKKRRRKKMSSRRMKGEHWMRTS